MLVKHYRDEIYAWTEADTPGVVVIHWVDPDIAPADDDVQCYGWVEGQLLFAPADGDGKQQWMVAGGTPDPNAAWYAVATGQGAIYGVGGALLSVLA